MATRGDGLDITTDETDASASLETGVRDQRLTIDGWFASHADRGTPGPHVRLHTNDQWDAVLRTNQIPALIEALTTVAGRIDRLWDVEGEQYTEDVLRHSPDPNDPGLRRRREFERLSLVESVIAHLPEVLATLHDAETMPDALPRLALILGVDEVAVSVALSRFNLFGLTRVATDGRRRRLAELQSPE